MTVTETFLKTRTINILTCSEHFESNEGKWCILTLLETYTSRLIWIRECYFIANFDFLFFSFLEMKCRPGPTGTIGATMMQ